MTDKHLQVGAIRSSERVKSLKPIPKSVLQCHLMASLELTELLSEVSVVGVKGLLLEAAVD